MSTNRNGIVNEIPSSVEWRKRPPLTKLSVWSRCDGTKGSNWFWRLRIGVSADCSLFLSVRGSSDILHKLYFAAPNSYSFVIAAITSQNTDKCWQKLDGDAFRFLFPHSTAAGVCVRSICFSNRNAFASSLSATHHRCARKTKIQSNYFGFKYCK